MPTTSKTVLTGEHIIYTAKAGDTWDMISYLNYGFSERYAALLIRANIRLANVVAFEGGEEVKVPIIEKLELPETLPPWRRNAT